MITKSKIHIGVDGRAFCRFKFKKSDKINLTDDMSKVTCQNCLKVFKFISDNEKYRTLEQDIMEVFNKRRIKVTSYSFHMPNSKMGKYEIEVEYEDNEVRDNVGKTNNMQNM